MSMKCTRCGRALLQPAKTIDSYVGALHFGRACAIKVGLLTPAIRTRALVAAIDQPDLPDPNQMALALECTP